MAPRTQVSERGRERGRGRVRTSSRLGAMRYGAEKSKHLEIDPAARRKQGQSLKKAAPGAPFGWDHEGRPYIGTQCDTADSKGDRGSCSRLCRNSSHLRAVIFADRVSADGTRFASVSTRNGGEQEYWQPMVCVSAKVATSALEYVCLPNPTPRPTHAILRCSRCSRCSR